MSTVTGLILTYHQTDAHLHDKTLCEGKLDPSIVKEIRSYQADVDKIINHILTTGKFVLRTPLRLWLRILLNIIHF